MGPRILVAGIGNIFLGDDAFGVEVVQRLAGRPLGPGVRVVDFGIRGYDLACALLEPRDLVILVDAVRRGGKPGTVYLMEIEEVPAGPVDFQGHSMDPAQVLRNARAMGGVTARVLLVGCEPTDCEEMRLSDPVEAAVEEAIAMIESLVKRSPAHA